MRRTYINLALLRYVLCNCLVFFSLQTKQLKLKEKKITDALNKVDKNHWRVDIIINFENKYVYLYRTLAYESTSIYLVKELCSEIFNYHTFGDKSKWYYVSTFTFVNNSPFSNKPDNFKIKIGSTTYFINYQNNDHNCDIEFSMKDKYCPLSYINQIKTKPVTIDSSSRSLIRPQTYESGQTNININRLNTTDLNRKEKCICLRLQGWCSYTCHLHCDQHPVSASGVGTRADDVVTTNQNPNTNTTTNADVSVVVNVNDSNLNLNESCDFKYIDSREQIVVQNKMQKRFICNNLVNKSDDMLLVALIQEVLNGDFEKDLIPTEKEFNFTLFFTNFVKVYSIEQAVNILEKKYHVLKLINEKMEDMKNSIISTIITKSEMLAIYLKCNGECGHSLSESQLNKNGIRGVFEKWKYFHSLLNNAIIKLNRIEKYNSTRYIYGGVSGVQLNVSQLKRSIKHNGYIYLSTNQSFSTDLQVAESYAGDNGIVIGIYMGNNIAAICNEFDVCDVSWISNKPHEKEVLARYGSAVAISHVVGLRTNDNKMYLTCGNGDPDANEEFIEQMFSL